MDTHTFAKLY